VGICVVTVSILDPVPQEAESSPPKNILVEKDKNITLIGINRPQQRNAIDSLTASQLCDAFANFEADDTSPVAVLYGVGGSFCSGFDILEISTDEKEEISVDILMRPEGSVGPTRRQIKKPVVCGINGYCIANGLELALMCDLRVMEESAQCCANSANWWLSRWASKHVSPQPTAHSPRQKRCIKVSCRKSR